MNEVAALAVRKLLDKAEAAWGRGSPPKRQTLPITEASLRSYFLLDTHAKRQDCHADLIRAAQAGAISLEWDARAGEQRHLSRVSLDNADAAAQLLGVSPRWNLLSDAQAALASRVDAFPVVMDILQAWRRGVEVRSTGPKQHAIWTDAIKVLERCRLSPEEDLPIRRISVSLFGDSKRVESLWPALDVLTQGSISTLARTSEEVFAEIGLVKFPSTLLIAGRASVCVAQRSISLAFPYLGFAPESIEMFTDLDQATVLLTVENLTTFHELCRKHRPDDKHVLVYTAGMPSPSWMRVYRLMLKCLPTTALIYHWGDSDAGGFRIADYLAKTAAVHHRQLRLFGMDGQLCPPRAEGPKIRRALSDAEIKAIARICDRWKWSAEARWIEEVRGAVEQESMRLDLPQLRTSEASEALLPVEVR